MNQETYNDENAGSQGPRGPKGRDGIGFKLIDNDDDMDSKKIYHLDTPSDYREEDGIEDKKLKNSAAVNKEYVNTSFLKKDPNKNYFNLKNLVTKNSEEYYDGLYIKMTSLVDDQIVKIPHVNGYYDIENKSLVNMNNINNKGANQSANKDEV